MRTKLTGVVASAKASKTLRVEVQRTYRHPVVGKYVRSRTVCHVHDENSEAGEGDIVEIEECPPKSKLKRWNLIRVVEKSKDAEAVRKLHERQEAKAAAEAAQSGSDDAAQPAASGAADQDAGAES